MENLIDMFKGAVSGQVMKQMGGLLGVEEKKTAGLFENAAGSILGGLMKKADSTQGANDVFDMVKKQDDGILDKLGDLLGGGKEEEFTKQGGGILDGIMGGQKQSTSMIETIAKALGLDKGMIGKLLTMAAPILMGVIGRHVKSKAMDAIGLKGLLGGQKKHVAAALPSGLGQQLGFGNLLGNTTDSVKSAASSTASAASSTANVASKTAGAATEGGGNLMKMLLPLLLLAALIIAGFFILPNLMGGGKKSEPIKVTSKNMEKYQTKIAETMTGLTTSVGDIKDFAGAEAFAPKLKDATDLLSGFDFSGLSADSMKDLKGCMDVSELRDGLKATYDAPYETEGVGEKIRELLAPLFTKFVEVIGGITKM